MQQYPSTKILQKIGERKSYMEQLNTSTKQKTGKHLTYIDRIFLETCRKQRRTVAWIASALNTNKEIRQIEEWINNYPRRILNFSSAREIFEGEMESCQA